MQGLALIFALGYAVLFVLFVLAAFGAVSLSPPPRL